MIILKINNSVSSLEGLSLEHHRKIKSLLSYTLNPSQSYYTGGFGPKTSTLLDKKGNFPTGVLHTVLKGLKSLNVHFSVQDQRIVPKSKLGMFKLDLKELTPYKEQVEATEIAYKQHRGIISAVTGFGKSIAMALLVNKLQVKTLIIVPNLNLKQQLQHNFLKYFGTLDNITIENIDSKKLNNMSNYDCLIIDEAHHVAARTYRRLNKMVWNKIYYRFFFTATPFRSRDEEQLLFESIAGKVIYSVSYLQAVDKKYIVPMEAYYYELSKTRTSSTNWHGVYSDLVVHNDQRNDVIADLIRNLKAAGKSVLCLVKEIEHGNILSQLSGTMFANGQDKDSENMIKFFNQGKIKALIGTTGLIGEGVDTKPCEYVIIAGLGKSKNAFMQQVGRGFRRYKDKESCKVILFKDNSHKWTKSHFKAQLQFLLEEYKIIGSKLS